MNAHPQPGMHPDAEALSAFAEQALGGRERELVLGHLAVCPRCRQIVALAAEAADVEFAAPAQAEASRKATRIAWWRNWRITWAPVAALACVVTLAVMVHVRRVERETESARTAQVLPQQQALAAPEPRQRQAEMAAPTAAAPAATPHRESAEQAASLKEPPPPSPQSVAIAAFSAQTATAPSNTGAGGTLGSAREGGGEPTAPPSMSTEAAAWRQQPAAVSAEQAQAMPANERRAWKMAAARPADTAAQPVPMAPAFKSAPAPASELHGLFAARVARPAPLPSGKAAVSTASIGRKEMAVDSTGAVFLSLDDGAHWSPVARQWSGQVVHVATKPGASPMAAAVFASPEAEDKAAPLAPPTPAVTFEISNDKGQRWTSADGHVWTPE